MHMCTCMTLLAGKRNSCCLYSNKHANFLADSVCTASLLFLLSATTFHIHILLKKLIPQEPTRAELTIALDWQHRRSRNVADDTITVVATPGAACRL